MWGVESVQTDSLGVVTRWSLLEPILISLRSILWIHNGDDKRAHTGAILTGEGTIDDELRSVRSTLRCHTEIDEFRITMIVD